MQNCKKLKKILINIFAWFVSLCALFPLIWMAYSSVKSNGDFLMDSLALPKEFVFINYPEAFEIGNLWLSMGNSLFYSVVNVTLVVTFAILTAYFLARYDFKGKNIVRIIYTMGMLTPLYALLVPIFVQYKMLGMLNNRLSLIISYYAMSIPLAIFLSESFIAGVPIAIDEASVVDGCSLGQRLLRIIFPLCMPIIATVAILTLLATWNEFAFAVILTPKLEMRTVSISLNYFTAGRELNYPFLMAALLSASLPVITAYLFFSKLVIKGMTAGAVKG